MEDTIITLIWEMKNIVMKVNFLHRSFTDFLPGSDALFSYFMVLPNGAKQGLRLEVGELVGKWIWCFSVSLF